MDVLLTLSEAKILNEAMTCSAVSVSAVSRVMKSMKAWKVTTPVLLESTRVMMRANSTSPYKVERNGNVSHARAFYLPSARKEKLENKAATLLSCMTQKEKLKADLNVGYFRNVMFITFYFQFKFVKKYFARQQSKLAVCPIHSYIVT